MKGSSPTPLPFLPAAGYNPVVMHRTSRLLRAVVTVVLLTAVAAPYGRVVVCPTSGGTPTAMAHEHHHAAGSAWAASGHAGACHDIAGCALAQVAPALEVESAVPDLLPVAQASRVPALSLVQNAAPPLTPPPRA